MGVRRDVVGIKDFYTLVSGETVELNGFLDLSVIATAAGFKLRAWKNDSFRSSSCGNDS